MIANINTRTHVSGIATRSKPVVGVELVRANGLGNGTLQGYKSVMS